jgi:hypothetical protein
MAAVSTFYAAIRTAPMSIVRVGLAETRKFGAGYDAIFAKKARPVKKSKPTGRKKPANKHK